MGTVGVHLLPVCRQLLATAKRISCHLKLAITKDAILAARRAAGIAIDLRPELPLVFRSA